MPNENQTTKPTPSPGATCSASLDYVTQEWARRERPPRAFQFAAVIHAQTVADVADELEYMAAKLRDGQITEGTGGGSQMAFAWSARYSPNV